MWNVLKSKADFLGLLNKSKEDNALPFVVFKHSTRCSISSMALNRLESGSDEISQHDIPMYYLDLIQFRELSNFIAQELGVEHQSPQILLVKGGMCAYHNSHMGVNVLELIENFS